MDGGSLPGCDFDLWEYGQVIICAFDHVSVVREEVTEVISLVGEEPVLQ